MAGTPEPPSQPGASRPPPSLPPPRRADVQVEVCVESAEGALAAEQGGADRIELCADLRVGGLTPSLGCVRAARAAVRLPIVVLIRPREGDFAFSAGELDVMRRDIEAVRAAGADGVALGVLRADGRIDTERTARLVEASRPLPVTFHRAFDRVPLPLAALEELVALGVSRVLTSGQARSAPEGAARLRELVEAAGTRLSVMPGGGVRAHNIRALLEVTGARHVHFSAGRPRAGGDGPPITDAALVRACIEALRP